MDKHGLAHSNYKVLTNLASILGGQWWSNGGRKQGGRCRLMGERVRLTERARCLRHGFLHEGLDRRNHRTELKRFLKSVLSHMKTVSINKRQ